MKYTNIVFDIDGTLIDSEKAVLISLADTLLEVTGKRYAPEALGYAVGRSSDDTFRRYEVPDLDAAKAAWRKNIANYSSLIVLYDGIKELLCELRARGARLGIITSKNRVEYKTDFEPFKLDEYFSDVVTADDTAEHKPSPAPMLEYLRRTGAAPERTLYIGDTVHDMKCASGAGVATALALWGSSAPGGIKADYKPQKPSDILRILDGSYAEARDDRIFTLAVELQALAQNGLAYSENRFDIERFERMREIAAELIDERTELGLPKIKELFCSGDGYQTPKIETRAVVFKNDKILLVREQLDRKWTLPGGWMDYDQSVGSNAVKEAFEEAGVEVTPERIIAVQDRNLHNHPHFAPGLCKVFVMCTLIGGEFRENTETLESGYFTLDDLPELSTGRTTRDQLEMCFRAKDDPSWTVLFD